MASILEHIHKHRKTVAVLAIAGAIALPMGVQAYTGSGDASEHVTVNQTEEVTQDETINEEVVTEEPVAELVVQETVTPEEEVPVEEVSGAVNVEEAALIAAAEHPDVLIVETKAKTINETLAFVFVFDDGWKVYVDVYTGDVVKVVDASDRYHECKNVYKEQEDDASVLGATQSADDDDGKSYRSGFRHHHRR